jgi:hypothetical protein
MDPVNDTRMSYPAILNFDLRRYALFETLGVSDDTVSSSRKLHRGNADRFFCELKMAVHRINPSASDGEGGVQRFPRDR